MVKEYSFMIIMQYMQKNGLMVKTQERNIHNHGGKIFEYIDGELIEQYKKITTRKYKKKSSMQRVE